MKNFLKNNFIKNNKVFIIIVSLILLCISMCNAGKCQKQLEAFDIGNSKHCVLFHSNGCGWCKKMLPEWKMFSKKHSDKIKISMVEANEDPELIQNLNIKGYPTIMLFENGNLVKTHNGDRSVKGFEEFVGIN